MTYVTIRFVLVLLLIGALTGGALALVERLL